GNINTHGSQERNAAYTYIVQSLLNPLRHLIEPLGEQVVIYVANGEDAADQANLLAFHARRVAAAVPALVMRPCDVLSHLDQGVGRVGEHIGAGRGVGLLDRPLFGVELARLEQDLVGNADLSDVVHRARMAEHLGLGRAPSDRERETLAEDPDAADVLARLRVTGLDRLRQALYQLKLAFAQPVREGVALDEGADVVRRHHADRAERQRRERI